MAQGKKHSRREREKLRQRNDMLTAALDLFSLKGYHNVSMNEIAEKAEFAVGTLYKFFENKEDLYRTLMIEQADWFHRTMTESLDVGGDEIEKLRNYVRATGVLVAEREAVVRLYHAGMWRASIHNRSGLDAKIHRQLVELREKVVAIFEQGIRKKVFREIAEPIQLALALEGICGSFIGLWLEDPEGAKYPDDPDVILNVIFKGLLHDEPGNPKTAADSH